MHVFTHNRSKSSLAFHIYLYTLSFILFPGSAPGLQLAQPVEPSYDAFLPAGQSVHAVAPGLSEKVPTLQKVQESARLAEKVPTPQVVQFVLRTKEKVPAEQSAQVVAAL
jgi:hypothetical protein